MGIDFTQRRPRDLKDQKRRSFGEVRKKNDCGKFHPKFVPGMPYNQAFCGESILHVGPHKNRRDEFWNEEDQDVWKRQDKNQEGPDDYVGGEEEY